MASHFLLRRASQPIANANEPDAVLGRKTSAWPLRRQWLPAVLLLALLVGCDSGQTDTPPTPSLALATETAAIPSPEPSLSQETEVPTFAPVSPPATPSQAATAGIAPSAVPTESTYVVQGGDTLGAIAIEFNTTVEALLQANDLASADVIYAGQTLKITSTAAGGVGGGAAETTPGTSRGNTPTALAEGGPSTVVLASTAVTRTTPAAPSTQTIGGLATPASEAPVTRPTSVVVNGRTYAAYNLAVIKKGQWYHYTCEFDAAWIVLKTYGFDVSLEKQVEIIGLDKSIEPYYKETANGVVIYGGDVTRAYSGDYKTNFLARSSGQAMRKVFDYYNLKVTPVRDRASLEAALLRGELIWIKTTVDYKPWTAATWIMPDGRSYKTVLGNDHAMVVMGFNKDGVVVRDPLGPTSTGKTRKYEYDVPWSKFMASWGAQGFDGLAVAPPGQ